jgi:hypothetical protein
MTLIFPLLSSAAQVRRLAFDEISASGDGVSLGIVRTMFTSYVLFIAGVLVFFVVIGILDR